MNDYGLTPRRRAVVHPATQRHIPRKYILRTLLSSHYIEIAKYDVKT